MRYDDMLSLYPDIEYLFVGVSELIHDNNIAPAMAAGWADRWISRYIAKEHRQGVTDKIRQFIAAICCEDTAKGIIPCDIQESFTNALGRS